MREMKDSGIVWIGETPQNWKTTKLLNVLRCPISDGPHETPELVNENGIPFISVDSLNSTKSVDLSIVKKFISQELYEEYNKKTNLEKNDILFSKAATIGKTAIIGDEKFMVWSPLAIIKVNKDNCVDYIYYLLNCEELIKHISLMGSYNTQINVGMRNLERAPIPVPLLSEQQKIADFLDTQCSKVDALIANQQSQIEKLKSYKQSLITEVVTKGLDKNVPMKDSGVERISKIPNHWNATQMKYLMYIRARLGWKGLKADEYLPAGYTFIGTPNIDENGNIDWENVYYISKERYDESPEIMLSKGDVLLTKDGAGIGKCAYIEDLPCEATTNGSLAVITCNSNLNGKYLFYYFKSYYFQKYIDQIKNGMGVPHLFQSDLKNIAIPVPPLEEQLLLLKHLDNKCKEIDKLISLKQQKIEKLQQYKKSLIYEYVTGKKEVK